ncbi:DMT family transporter [Helicobacter apodemus]|uniref:DMT family transporter n=1 Tax=Helicobacter apodemus TaxID=135569 RepID=UPI001EF32E5B|nr:DMT family transporter [Helicobacter apodemus]
MTNIFKPQQESLILTRKMVFYGIIFITPTLFFENISFNLAPLLEPKIFLNLLFVAFFASAFCFILWNKAIILIGSIRTNIYVYLTPVITLFASVIFLDESIQSLAIAGMILVLSGVFVATRR